MPSVAIVLATLNRPSVREVLAQVCGQAPHDAEIVVVDQSERDERDRTRRWAEERRDPRLRVLHVIRRSLPAARNTGLEATRAPLVLFLDDDVHLHAGCISAHLSRYRDSTVGGVVGRIVEERLRPNAWRTTNRVGPGGRVITRLDGPDPVLVHTLKGANMSFRRRALADAGGFDPGFAGNALLEDADASLRVRKAGWRLVYEPEAAVDHHHEPSGGVRDRPVSVDWWRFHNTARYVRRHRGAWGLPGLVVTHCALATQRAVRARHAGTAVTLLRALQQGWNTD